MHRMNTETSMSVHTVLNPVMMLLGSPESSSRLSLSYPSCSHLLQQKAQPPTWDTVRLSRGIRMAPLMSLMANTTAVYARHPSLLTELTSRTSSLTVRKMLPWGLPQMDSHRIKRRKTAPHGQLYWSTTTSLPTSASAASMLSALAASRVQINQKTWTHSCGSSSWNSFGLLMESRQTMEPKVAASSYYGHISFCAPVTCQQSLC
jgi:hypothetical protein